MSSRESRVTDQLTDGSRGSRVKKCDPLSSLQLSHCEYTPSFSSRLLLLCAYVPMADATPICYLYGVARGQPSANDGLTCNTT